MCQKFREKRKVLMVPGVAKRWNFILKGEKLV